MKILDFIGRHAFAWRKSVMLLLIIGVPLWLWHAPADLFGIEGLTLVQQRVIAIFAFATLMWIFELVPAWATSVGIIGALLAFTSDNGIGVFRRAEVATQGDGGMIQPLGQLLSYKEIMATFADPVIMLFIGGFVLAIAATKTGLDAQLARTLIRPFGNKSSNVLLGFILITGVFSMFISNTATAAMMLTFLAPVFRQLPTEGKGRIALTLSIPLAANLGGMATPIGTPPNAIAMKYLNDPVGLNIGIGFDEWMMLMFPLVLALLFIVWYVLLKLYPFQQKTIEIVIPGQMKHNAHSWIVIVTFITTIACWVSESYIGINSYTVALLPFVVFSLTGVIDRKDLEQINWSVIWMVAGGFALGYALNESGLAANAVKSIPFGEWSALSIALIAGIVCYFLSNFISNSATAALLMPILAVVCTGMGSTLDAIGGTTTVLLGIALAASSAMVLPISTPPNALAYSTNLVAQKHMAKVGLIVGAITLVLGYTLLIIVGQLHWV